MQAERDKLAAWMVEQLLGESQTFDVDLASLDDAEARLLVLRSAAERLLTGVARDADTALSPGEYDALIDEVIDRFVQRSPDLLRLW